LLQVTSRIIKASKSLEKKKRGGFCGIRRAAIWGNGAEQKETIENLGKAWRKTPVGAGPPTKARGAQDRVRVP